MGKLKVFLAFLLVVASLSFIFAEDIPTTVNVEDSPPYIIKDIEDIFLIINEDAIDYLDLDDYFGEDNGDELNITYSSIENVTITIDSEHKVSFYPQTGYMGTQTLRFVVADAVGEARGNWFNLTVGQDTSPPTWYNPQRSRSTVTQNSVVNFTTIWRDNVRLGSYIFSMNQGEGWVNSTRIVFSGTQNISNVKTAIIASPNSVVYWRFYAEDFYGNANVTDIQTFTVKEVTVSPNDSVIEIDDYDPGDTSTAGSTGTQALIDAFLGSPETSNFKTDINNLKVSLRQGESTTKVVKVSNVGNTKLQFSIKLFGLERYTVLGINEFYLNPGETKGIIIDFQIPSSAIPDQYFGVLQISANDEVVDVPIALEIRPFESELKLEVIVPEDYKNVRPGKLVTANIKLSSIKDTKEMNVSLYYAIKDFSGNIINTSTKEVTLFASLDEILNLTVPKDTENNEYLFYVRATSSNLVDIGSDTFFVGIRFKILQIIERFIFLILFLILLAILIILYLNHERNKEKQQALELYVMLNELRNFVKEGKTEEAIEIYKRIKLAYGQHISKDFQKDKELLKGELDKFAKLLSQNPIKQDVPKTASPSAAPKTKPAPSTATSPTTNPKLVVKQSPVAIKVSEQKPQPKPVAKPEQKPQPKPVTQPAPTEIKKEEVSKNSPVAAKVTNTLIKLKDKIMKKTPTITTKTPESTKAPEQRPTAKPEPIKSVAKPTPQPVAAKPVAQPAPTEIKKEIKNEK